MKKTIDFGIGRGVLRRALLVSASALVLVASAAHGYAADVSGDLVLPTIAEMEERSARVAAWKRANTNFEPQRGFTTSNHFHQYFGALLGDLGVNARRKKNAVAEIFSPYDAADYAGVVDEYRAGRSKRTAPLRPLPLDT